MRNDFSSKSIHILSAPNHRVIRPDGAPPKSNPFPRLRVDSQIHKIYVWKVSAHLFSISHGAHAPLTTWGTGGCEFSLHKWKLMSPCYWDKKAQGPAKGLVLFLSPKNSVKQLFEKTLFYATRFFGQRFQQFFFFGGRFFGHGNFGGNQQVAKPLFT